MTTTAPFDLRQLQHFVKQCDPMQPLGADDQRYVNLDGGTPVRGSDGPSAVDEIERTILFSEPTSATCQIFTGFQGTGKTTELARLKKRLEENKLVSLHVVLFDFQSYRTDQTPLSIIEMLRVLAYELDREATRSEGGDKLTELVGRRLDLRSIFGPALDHTLHPLIAASGGYTRDLLRMVREVLWGARAFPVDPAVIQRIIERAAEGYVSTVRDEDADVLAEIARTHELPGGDSARLAIFGRLLQRFLVLAYRNGHPWYDLHPLVRECERDRKLRGSSAPGCRPPFYLDRRQ